MNAIGATSAAVLFEEPGDEPTPIERLVNCLRVVVFAIGQVQASEEYTELLDTVTEIRALSARFIESATCCHRAFDRFHEAADWDKVGQRGVPPAFSDFCRAMRAVQVAVLAVADEVSALWSAALNEAVKRDQAIAELLGGRARVVGFSEIVADRTAGVCPASEIREPASDE